MRFLPFLIFLAFIGGQYSALAQGQEIPQKYFGAFLLDQESRPSDHWDEYLRAKGYADESVRRQVKLPKMTRILYPLSPGFYRMMIGEGLVGSKWVKGSKKNADWKWQLGKQFKGKYWDGNEHLITFIYDPVADRLIERHIIGGQYPPEEYIYTINDENNLDFQTNFNGVQLIHHYVRTD